MSVPQAAPVRSARRTICAIGCLGLGFALAACAGMKAVSDPATITVQRGKRVAEQRCAAGHSVAPGAPSPIARAPAFASLEMRHTSGLDGRVADLTWRGHYDMPPINLDPDEVNAIVAYIQSLPSAGEH